MVKKEGGGEAADGGKGVGGDYIVVGIVVSLEFKCNYSGVDFKFEKGY